LEQLGHELRRLVYELVQPGHELEQLVYELEQLGHELEHLGYELKQLVYELEQNMAFIRRAGWENLHFPVFFVRAS
jgi:hypothetical protein